MFCPQDGASALFLAAQEGNVEVVRLLIEANTLVNIQRKVYTSLFHTPLPHMTERNNCYWYMFIIITIVRTPADRIWLIHVPGLLC